VPPIAAPQFRPLSTGEVLDRSFALYRQRFWLFVGIGMVPAAVLLLTSAGRLIFLAATHRMSLIQPAMIGQRLPATNLYGTILLAQAYFIPTFLLFLVAYGISHAATVDAVNRIGQGMAASVSEAYGEVRGRWLRWCGITLRQYWSLAWPALPGLVLLFGSIGFMAMPGTQRNPLLLASVAILAWMLMMAGLVLGVIGFIRNMLAIPASVSENIGVNAAMRRSKMLVAGRKGRIFLALLLFYALELVVAGVQAPLLFAAMSLRGGALIGVQAVMMLVQFVSVALVSPVASIVFTLFYIDERVRREGFDIELLMQRTLPPANAYPTEI
jgi:hypothetical protein